MREAVIQYVKWVIERFPFQEPILDTCLGWEPNFCEPLFPGKRHIKQNTRGFDPLYLKVICGRDEPHCRCECVSFVWHSI